MSWLTRFLAAMMRWLGAARAGRRAAGRGGAPGAGTIPTRRREKKAPGGSWPAAFRSSPRPPRRVRCRSSNFLDSLGTAIATARAARERSYVLRARRRGRPRVPSKKKRGPGRSCLRRADPARRRGPPLEHPAAARVDLDGSGSRSNRSPRISGSGCRRTSMRRLMLLQRTIAF